MADKGLLKGEGFWDRQSSLEASRAGAEQVTSCTSYEDIMGPICLIGRPTGLPSGDAADLRPLMRRDEVLNEQSDAHPRSGARYGQHRWISEADQQVVWQRLILYRRGEGSWPRGSTGSIQRENHSACILAGSPRRLGTDSPYRETSNRGMDRFTGYGGSKLRRGRSQGGHMGKPPQWRRSWR